MTKVVLPLLLAQAQMQNGGCYRFPMTDALLSTTLGRLPLVARGKVRDIYALGADLLFVATDRISAFDHVLGSGIPDKGKILTGISAFWFDFLKGTVANHLLSTKPSEMAKLLEPFSGLIFGERLSPGRIFSEPVFQKQIAGRSMIVRRARMFPVECVVRGYLSGSGWKDYQATGAVCGIQLPPGLLQSERLPEPMFTPAAKVNTGGHDENISYAQMEATVGVEAAAELRRLTLDIYAKAAGYAAAQGLILADTKFEFGFIDGVGVVLADEVLTPDSSRYWPATGYAPGGPQPSFDKQFVRDYLESIGWNKQAPAPVLPEDVVTRTRQKYMEAFRLITGQQGLGGAQEPVGSSDLPRVRL
jgi:phosphoribosylaminoimidazole-succinocarboxamide synthase